MLSIKNHLVCWVASVSIALATSLVSYGHVIFPLSALLQYVCELCPFLADIAVSHMHDLTGATKASNEQLQTGQQEKPKIEAD
jgi:hypothetical protein